MLNGMFFMGLNNMTKKICFGLVALCMTLPALGAGVEARFADEVLTGLDIISARENVDVVLDDAPGELGRDVYQTVSEAPRGDIRIFIPTDMYMRAGGGLNLGFATSKAAFGPTEHESSGSWTTQIGLGWNLSSYVRTEIDFQTTSFKFSDLDDFSANSKSLGAMVYFDFARRYVMTGDVTVRRSFVPFMGLGAGVAWYQFEGASGADGIAVAAPRAALGFNVMLTDLIGVDVMYQYQMMIDRGFGWNTNDTGITSISNIMASVRVNF